MKVGYLTIVFADDITAKEARTLTDEIAGNVIDEFEQVNTVKCDIGELGASLAEIEAFWDEAFQS